MYHELRKNKLTWIPLNGNIIVVLLCKSEGILVGPGRGSVGGSLVAYCVGITEIDPIKYDLSFARFLNKARMMTSLGDIDVDIPKKDRPYVLKLMREKFGEDKTCQIVNDVYFTDKTTIKDLGRIFGVDFKVTNKLTSLIGDGESVEDVLRDWRWRVGNH